jgi:hypothetical protein
VAQGAGSGLAGGMKRIRALLCTCLSVAWVLPARGGITFEKAELAHKAGHGEVQVTGEFKFKVTGGPVKILDVETYCDCLKAQTKDGRMEFKDGEEGVIETAFRLGNFEGEVAKQVVVTTDDPAARATTLTVKVTIPHLFEIEPEHVRWQAGDEPKPKSIKFKIIGDKPVAVTKVVSSRDVVTAEFREVTKGREYEIILTPKSTAEPVFGVLRVETDAPWPRFQKRLLFFNVSRPGAPAPIKQP